VYSGTTSTGSLRKNYFSYTPSAFHGSPYLDPGKVERRLVLQEGKKWEGKEVYKPAMLNKTLYSIVYEESKHPTSTLAQLTRRRKREIGEVLMEKSSLRVQIYSSAPHPSWNTSKIRILNTHNALKGRKNPQITSKKRLSPSDWAARIRIPSHRTQRYSLMLISRRNKPTRDHTYQ
jgi:hypothetical protein